MLTAWEKSTHTTVALPDFRLAAEREELRERTRQGNLICRTSRNPCGSTPAPFELRTSPIVA